MLRGRAQPCVPSYKGGFVNARYSFEAAQQPKVPEAIKDGAPHGGFCPSTSRFPVPTIELMTLLVSACAVVDPYITPPSFPPVAGADAYGRVVAGAHEVTAEMHDKLTQTEAADFWSGAAVVVAGLTATGLGPLAPIPMR